MWRQLRVVEVTDVIATAAGNLAERMALRGHVAFHLASAVAASEGELVMVATWDEELGDAALALGLAAAP